jgi:hypothetical protein
MSMISKPFGDIITFTRAGEGGRFNALGQYEMVPANTPRLTHDPVTLQPLGIRVEESRTNLRTASNEFSFAFNSGGRAVLADNSSVSPSGLTDADNLSNPTGTTAVFNRSVVAVSSGQTYTDSFFMRPGAGQSGSIGVYFGGSASTGGVFRSLAVINGVLSSSNSDTIVSALRNGWYRVACTYTPSVTAVTQVFNLSAGMSFDLWGGQLELGASATSYIPTGASQVTRAADVCSVNTLSPWYNALEGTLVVEFVRGSISPSQTFATLRGAFNSTMTLESGSGAPGQLRLRVNDAGTQQAIPIGSNSSAAGVPYKMAGAYAANSFAVAVNGQPAAVASSGTVPTVTRMEIGNVNSVAFINGTISRLTYYPRALSAEELQAITA